MRSDLDPFDTSAMTQQERLFWLRFQRRAANASPDVSREILRAIERLRTAIPQSRLLAAIESGPQAVEALFSDALLDATFAPVRHELEQVVQESARHYARALPRANSQTITFGVVNPNVVAAIQQLDTKVMTTLRADIRGTVRAVVEQGYIEGRGTATTAKLIRESLGLPPSNVRYLDNLRAELTEGKFVDAARRKLIDKRFNLANLDKLSPEQKAARIDKIVAAYEQRLIAQNAHTVARTATLDGMKLGQQLSIRQAVDAGHLDGSRLVKTWVTVGDDRVRDTHVLMEGDTVPWDQPFRNGQNFPGEGEWNCRCIERYTTRRAA